MQRIIKTSSIYNSRTETDNQINKLVCVDVDEFLQVRLHYGSVCLSFKVLGDLFLEMNFWEENMSK